VAAGAQEGAGCGGAGRDRPRGGTARRASGSRGSSASCAAGPAASRACLGTPWQARGCRARTRGAAGAARATRARRAWRRRPARSRRRGGPAPVSFCVRGRVHTVWVHKKRDTDLAARLCPCGVPRVEVDKGTVLEAGRQLLQREERRLASIPARDHRTESTSASAHAHNGPLQPEPTAAVAGAAAAAESRWPRLRPIPHTDASTRCHACSAAASSSQPSSLLSSPFHACSTISRQSFETTSGRFIASLCTSPSQLARLVCALAVIGVENDTSRQISPRRQPRREECSCRHRSRSD